jgi:hypothetical protein
VGSYSRALLLCVSRRGFYVALALSLGLSLVLLNGRFRPLGDDR